MEDCPLLVPFWARESMYVFSQLRFLSANTTSYLTIKNIKCVAVRRNYCAQKVEEVLKTRNAIYSLVCTCRY
jgi:hypothetical protein